MLIWIHGLLTKIKKLLLERYVMATYAILTAGGVGSRMANEIPKQFINVYDKPVIVYTMEAFQRHPGIDGIIVSCLKGWEPVLSAYAREFGIAKLMAVVPGGETGQQSIYNALAKLEDTASDDDLVVIHDGNRAFVSQEIISNAIGVAEAKGDAVACIPCVEVIAKRDTNVPDTARVTIDRDSLERTQTPHVFHFGDILTLHEWARENGVETAAAPELLTLRGRAIHFSPGDETNFKITTQGDLRMFKALLAMRNSD